MRRHDEHKRFLKRLENERPQPQDEFLSAMADRLASRQARRGGVWRVAFAGGFTALLVLAFALTGGIGYAASAVQGGTTAVTSLVIGSSKADKANTSTNAAQVNRAQAQGNQQSSARKQYQEKVAICHRPPGNPENEYTIFVSENAVPAHEAHGDTRGLCPNRR